MKRLLRLLAAITLVAGCVTSPREAVPAAIASVDAYLAELNDDNFTGVVLVAKDFVPFATKATGYSDRDRGSPNATITPFNIASVTQVFTAAAIGQLVDQGKVSLDDPLTNICRRIRNRPAIRSPSRWLSVTPPGRELSGDPGYLGVRDTSGRSRISRRGEHGLPRVPSG